MGADHAAHAAPRFRGVRETLSSNTFCCATAAGADEGGERRGLSKRRAVSGRPKSAVPGRCAQFSPSPRICQHFLGTRLAYFLKPTMKDIADHGGKYLAGGYNKTLSLSGAEPPNRVVIVQFANMDAVKEWRDQGATDMENTVGSKHAKFRIYAVEGVTQ